MSASAKAWRFCTPRASSDRAGPDEPKEQSNTSTDVELSNELYEYLRLIRDLPGVPATERDRQRGISLKAGSLARKQLREMGLIEEVPISPGVWGKNYKDVRLTSMGEKLMGKESAAGTAAENREEKEQPGRSDGKQRSVVESALSEHLQALFGENRGRSPLGR